MIRLSPGVHGRLLCVAVIIISLTACSFVSMMWWPMYWYVVNEVLPPRPLFKPPSAASNATSTQISGQTLGTSSVLQAQASNMAAPSHTPVHQVDNPPMPPASVSPAPTVSKQEEHSAETIAGGHGVARDPEWQVRRPHSVIGDALEERDYLMNSCAPRLVLATANLSTLKYCGVYDARTFATVQSHFADVHKARAAGTQCTSLQTRTATSW
jgi:hypothetical protein